MSFAPSATATMRRGRPVALAGPIRCQTPRGDRTGGADRSLEAGLAGRGPAGICALAQDGAGCIELSHPAAGRVPPASHTILPRQRLGTHSHHDAAGGDPERCRLGVPGLVRPDVIRHPVSPSLSGGCLRVPMGRVPVRIHTRAHIPGPVWSTAWGIRLLTDGPGPPNRCPRSAHARAGMPASMATDRPAAAGVARPVVRPRIGSVGTRAAPGPEGRPHRCSGGPLAGDGPEQCRGRPAGGGSPAIAPARMRTGRGRVVQGRKCPAEDHAGHPAHGITEGDLGSKGILGERRGKVMGEIRVRQPCRRCRLKGHGARASGSGAGGGLPCRWGSPLG